jgi:hypothetical protein
VPSEPVPRNVPRRVGRAKALVAVRIRDHRPPEEIEAARAELAEANAEADVASWPPLSLEARAKIACAILSAGSDAT